MVRKVLVLGSSVSTGEGSTKNFEKGWSAKLATRIKPLGFETRNRGCPGTNAKFWQEAVDHEDVSDFAVVIVALSLGNEGYKSHKEAAGIEKIRQRYVHLMLDISQKLRKQMHPSARLVLGGPYPNGEYTLEHLDGMRKVFKEMGGWKHVDHVTDFLLPLIHDGKGHWVEGAAHNAGHPNDLGHQRMFECLDIEAILGPDVESLPIAREESPFITYARTAANPLLYRYAGPRDELMAEAAVGWFDRASDTLTWRSFNGNAEDKDTWEARNVWDKLTIKDGLILRWDGSAGGKVEVDELGFVTAVLWGEHRWQLYDPFGVDRSNNLRGFLYGLPSDDPKITPLAWVEQQGQFIRWRQYVGHPGDSSSWDKKVDLKDLQLNKGRVEHKDGTPAATVELDAANIADLMVWDDQPERHWRVLRGASGLPKPGAFVPEGAYEPEAPDAERATGEAGG